MHADLESGGKALVPLLEQYRGAADTLVLAIVRGGVPAACEIARMLELPIDLVLLRGLLQRTDGSAARAMRIAGTLLLDDELANRPPAPVTLEDTIVADGLAALAQREIACRGERPPVSIADKTVIVVDNGIRSGTTIETTLRAVRRLSPARVIAAVPVVNTSYEPCLADEYVYLMTPRPIGNVAMGYRRFDVPNEARIRALLEAHCTRQP